MLTHSEKLNGFSFPFFAFSTSTAYTFFRFSNNSQQISSNLNVNGAAEEDGESRAGSNQEKYMPLMHKKDIVRACKQKEWEMGKGYRKAGIG